MSLLNVLQQTAKLANVAQEQYPTQFALSLIHKDFRLILDEAYVTSVPLPATAVAKQMYTAALAKEMEADFSIMIRFMEELADVPGVAEAPGAV